jgi:eukaryotic-like serine/threonine-protein kinase
MKLQRGIEWVLGARLDGGGFGQVYAAKSAEYESAAAKLVPKAPGAERELLLSDLHGVRNIVPVIDQGETDDNWVLVMPRAEKSLRTFVLEAGGSLEVAAAVRVLTDIAATLVDLDGRVVHRDLKPENVLLLDGHWCLADFGISRYAEATTAPDTRKYAMTPGYAAPEQWRFERANAPADVYAFGIIAYELLAGSLPFTGPDFRDQHLRMAAAPLAAAPTALAALIEECLYKAADARPVPQNILARLARVGDAAPLGGLARLQQADRANVARKGEIGRQASAEQSEAEWRETLAATSEQALTRIAATLRDVIMDAAPSASLSTGLKIGWTIQLDQAELRLAPPTVASASPWGLRGLPVFAVIAFSELSLRVPADRFGYVGRSHSLWFCDAQEAGRYQWFEVAFMHSPLMAKTAQQDPFSLKPGEDAAAAVGAGMAHVQVAWPFTALTPGNLDEFIGRWAAWLGDASQGQIHRPSAMPERDPGGSWRR